MGDVNGALLRCEKTALGNYLPRNEADAQLLHGAGMCWTPNHWWHPLNMRGIRQLWRLRNGDAA